MLHEGNFSSDVVILVTIMRSHSADSQLSFAVIEEPKVRQVRVLLDFGRSPEFFASGVACHSGGALDCQGGLLQSQAENRR